jgi:Zn-dependent peptidase ImmA (M78 family)
VREERGWGGRRAVREEELARLLAERWGYRIDESTLEGDRDLGGLRSVYAAGDPPVLYVNGRLLPAQRAFLLAREVGYRVLGLEERAITSSWLKVESFDQVLNNFRASYFAGALLIPAPLLEAQLRRFFGSRTFEPAALLSALDRFGATPEMLFYRVTELAPARFGLPELYFVRFQRDADRRRPRLTKVLNLSRVQTPHGVGGHEHACGRWPGIAILDDPALARSRSATPVWPQRSRFLSDGVEFFVVAAARPLALRPGAVTSVSLGFLVDERLAATARFLDDPAVPRVEVDLTCERCPLTARECAERAAPASVRERGRNIAAREAALARLVARSR